MVRCNTACAGTPECKVDGPQLNGSRGSLGTIENPYDLVEYSTPMTKRLIWNRRLVN